MREALLPAGLIGLIPAVLGIKKAIEALQIVSVFTEGMRVASHGGDLSPYITGLIFILVGIMLPVGLINALADL